MLVLPLLAQDPKFDTESRLVLVPATVTDAKGRPVDDLAATDFLLLDDGRTQAVAVDTLATGVAPIALVIAVQASGISEAVLAKVRKIGAMIQPVITGERGCAALVAFAETVTWLQECTADVNALARAFEKLQPGEQKSGRMLDAVHEAIGQLRMRPNVRRVLLLISESRDRGSETELDTVLEEAQAAGVTVYAATYSAIKTAFTAKPSDVGPPHVKRGATLPTGRPETLPTDPRVTIPSAEQRVDIQGALEELSRLHKTKTTEVLTEETGGATFSFAKQKGLEAAIERLGDELHRQYVLSFTPENPAAGHHDIEVRIRRAGDYRVRARPGYWWGERK